MDMQQVFKYIFNCFNHTDFNFYSEIIFLLCDKILLLKLHTDFSIWIDQFTIFKLKTTFFSRSPVIVQQFQENEL